MAKQFYKSRTLWVNLLAAVAFFVQAQFGFVIPAELQGMILGAINMILRLDTTEPVSVR